MNLREIIRACLKCLSSRKLLKTQRGFTLIEILVVIGMLAILTTVVLVAVNPLRQFAQARNSQRESNVAALLNAVTERIADNGGLFVSSSSELTTPSCNFFLPIDARNINKTQLDLRSCLVPSYLPELPYDPSNGYNACTTAGCDGQGENYDLEYTIQQDPATNRVTICAPYAKETALASSTPFCLTR
jgi:prepilin-type N-terminal cleavage/methylation domain-containing protein